MHNNLNWDEFADATVRLLVQPEKDDPVLIIADTSNNIVLAESFLAAAIRYGADAQLIIKKRYPAHTASLPGPILSEAMIKLIIGLVNRSAKVIEIIIEMNKSKATTKM